MPFFPESTLVSQRPMTGIPLCGSCGLYKKCKSPKMEVDGLGKRKILIVGEAPGADEDQRGKPFVGRTGKYLRGVLKQYGICMYKDCWTTNALICRPPNNAKPTEDQIDYCHANLTKVIQQHQPEVIIAVGHAAIASVTKEEWNDSISIMSRWVGAQIPSQKYNAWICPIYHPSFVLREVENAKNGTPIVDMYYQHIKAISKIKGRPYKNIPDVKSLVEVIVSNDSHVNEQLEEFTETGGQIAFDYETNMLKPGDKGRIISVGICWEGFRTIAFPWTKGVKKSFQRLMQSEVAKYGHNLKFEDQWSRANGISVHNWKWDTMTSAHVLDGRKEICSLGFQAYIHLGIGTYNQAVESFLKEKYSYKRNQIKKVDLHDLLLYNGIDAWTTFQLAESQMKRVNREKQIEN